MFELEQSLELHQTLSPQQIQSLQILAYTNQELEEFLKNEYFENNKYIIGNFYVIHSEH